MQPRVQAPSLVKKNDVFQVKTIIDHIMETGLRHDEAGAVIPRLILNSLVCRYNGAEVFRADLREAVAANPYVAFYVRAEESGVLQFTWEEDGGATIAIEAPITVQS